jgi:hypothetical protein
MSLFWVSVPCSGRVCRRPLSCTARCRNPNQTIILWTSTVITWKLVSPITSCLTRKIIWPGPRLCATFRSIAVSLQCKVSPQYSPSRDCSVLYSSYTMTTRASARKVALTESCRYNRRPTHIRIGIQLITVTTHDLACCTAHCTFARSGPLLSGKTSGRAAYLLTNTIWDTKDSKPCRCQFATDTDTSERIWYWLNSHAQQS